MKLGAYAAWICDRLALSRDVFAPVTALVLDGKTTEQIAATLEISQALITERLQQVRHASKVLLGHSANARTPVRVAMLEMIVRELEFQARPTPDVPQEWRTARPGELECKLMGPTTLRFTQDAVRLMTGEAFDLSTEAASTIYEASLPFLERYLGRMRPPLDLRACLLAVRAVHFEDEAARLRTKVRTLEEALS